MKKLISYFTAALTALTVGALSFGTATQAQPLAVAHSAILQDMAPAKQGLSQNVQYYPERRHYRNNHSDRPRHWNGPRNNWNYNRPNYRPYYRPYNPPHYRPYYRPAPPRYYQPVQPRYYQPAPPRHYRSGKNAHVNWCYNRYRSYRASDNTFQPNYGPRRQCYSPYI